MTTGISRRQFLFLTASAMLTGRRTIAARPDHVVNAGSASRYAADGIYDGFADLGFFLVRKGDSLVALSSSSTHRKCKLAAKAGQLLACPCHGSTFDPTGKVTAGPAKRNLPALPLSTNENGELLIRIPRD